MSLVYDLCGICEKEGQEVFWFSPCGKGAHKNCYKLISAAESKLNGGHLRFVQRRK